MPQLSLYIDDITLKKVETAARINNLSISRFVVGKLNEAMNDSWPENYGSLYGSIQDESFTAEQKLSYSDDIPREEL